MKNLAPLLLTCSSPAFAQGGPLMERQKERESERWSFSNYLAGKSKLQYQDVLYRFYTNGQAGQKPRIEPYIYGEGSSGKGGDGPLTGAGYGGTIYFNNFISALLNTPTPNVVLGLIAERIEEKTNAARPLSLYWGGSLRVAGFNQQDSALFLNYKVIRQDTGETPVSEQRWELAARLYLIPALSAEGSWLVKDSVLPSLSSPLLAHHAYSWGGALDLAMFRIALLQRRDLFTPRRLVLENRGETRYVLRVGFVL